MYCAVTTPTIAIKNTIIKRTNGFFIVLNYRKKDYLIYLVLYRKIFKLSISKRVSYGIQTKRRLGKRRLD